MKVCNDDAAIIFCIVVNHTPNRYSYSYDAGVSLEGDVMYYHDVAPVAYANYVDATYERWYIRKPEMHHGEYDPQCQRDRLTFSSRRLTR